MADLAVHLNRERGTRFIDSVRRGRFTFALVISYTKTGTIPGITAAGASPQMTRFTSPADAEFLHYGSCICIDKIPCTPDGKPTPALVTKAALESASIPHFVVNAGSVIGPNMPYVHTGLGPGGDISQESAMTHEDVVRAVDYGRIVGRTLGSLTDCLVIGESIPGGTTTAMATLHGLGIDARVSSSMERNPLDLKNSVIQKAKARLRGREPFSVVCNMGDPMIPFVAGMLSTASTACKVLLAGGTQMAAVVAFARPLGYAPDSVAIGTTSYVIDDKSANLLETVQQIGDVPVITADPLLSESSIPGLAAFSRGHAKEGAGAGGSVISAMLKTGISASKLLAHIEGQYRSLT